MCLVFVDIGVLVVHIKLLVSHCAALLLLQSCLYYIEDRRS